MSVLCGELFGFIVGLLVLCVIAILYTLVDAANDPEFLQSIEETKKNERRKQEWKDKQK